MMKRRKILLVTVFALFASSLILTQHADAQNFGSFGSDESGERKAGSDELTDEDIQNLLRTFRD